MLTDSEARCCTQFSEGQLVVPVEFARKLERDLIESKTKTERAHDQHQEHALELNRAIAGYIEELAALRVMVKFLEVDKARLDWLCENYFWEMQSTNRGVEIQEGGRMIGSCDIRSAIDKASTPAT